ncbi:MAG: aspartate-semialdehyde dehydrogenase [Desulfurococcales archaeon]|nr:aspartate-semialdehyde dehydrogenase [Desulfurococcales archaeon]
MKYRVCVLGATGLVGQRFVSLLARHPWFELEILTASKKYVGMKYGEVVNWVVDNSMPEDVGEIEISSVDPEVIAREKPDIAFSALPSDVAVEVEVELLKRGINVVSNASPMRMEPDVPLLNPEVNADHLELVKQQVRRGWRGILAKVPNCSTAILTLALKPIADEFGIKRVIVSTMQSVSGAGFRGVPSVAILDNVIPYIKGEENKVERETLKILGSVEEGKIRYADIGVTASCHRVMVLDGHLEAVFVETSKKTAVEEVKEVLREFRGNKIRGMNLPTAPSEPVVVKEEPDRPQPRLDRMAGRGMSVVVGRVREDKVLGGVKFVVLGHNTVRGAAGTAVLIAELITREGLI